MRRLIALMVSVAASWPCAVAAQHLRPTDLANMVSAAPQVVEAYGAGSLQFGELRLPEGKGPFPVVVLIHGGCWTKGFADLAYMRPLSARLTAHGVATWNIEYRQLGDPGGGWPGSFHDWGAGADHIRQLAVKYPLDLSRVAIVGHSAGAHGALWVAARPRLPKASEIRGAKPIAPIAVFAVDGPGDVGEFLKKDASICGKPVIVPFMGGGPEHVRDRYTQGNPVEMTPSRAGQTLMASRVLTTAEAERYAAAVRRRGAAVDVVTVQDAAHFDMLAPERPAGDLLADLVLKAMKIPRR